MLNQMSGRARQALVQSENGIRSLPLALIDVEPGSLGLLQEAQVDAAAVEPRHHPNVCAALRRRLLHRVPDLLEKLQI